MFGWPTPANNEVGLRDNDVLLLQLGHGITRFEYVRFCRTLTGRIGDYGRMYWDMKKTDLANSNFESVSSCVDE